MNQEITMNQAFIPYLYTYDKRYEVYWGGRSSGKSYHIVDKLIIKSLNDVRRVLFVKKTSSSIRTTIWQLVIEELERLKIARKDYTIYKSIFQIELYNGSIFLFSGFDDPDKAKGLQGLTDIYADEADSLTEDDFDTIDKSLRHPTAQNQQFILSFNPTPLTNWVWNYWFKSGEHPDALYHHSTYKDNAFIPEGTKKSILDLQRTNPQKYQMIAEGKFVALGKLVYPNIRVETFDPKAIKGTRIFGLDFGFSNDETAFSASIVDQENKILYIFDEHYETEMTNDEIAEMIKSKGFSREIIMAESAEPKSIEEIKRNGIQRIRPVKKGGGSINSGIQKVQQYEIVVHAEKCPNTIIEFENYSYMKDKTTGFYTNKPIDKFNHLMDAIRYSISAVDINRKIRSMPKSALGL